MTDTLRGLMSLVSAAGGKIDARIKVQKQAFLMASLNSGIFEKSSFSYHHYGPYSREIADTLQFAVSTGLLMENKEQGASDRVRYSYSMTTSGQKFLAEAGEPRDREVSIIRAMQPFHWRAHELAATIRFLEIEGAARDREHAISEAIRLKPETVDFQGDALALLNIIDEIAEPQLT